MKAVFIPKPGKDSYDRATSWRPISLMTFLLKVMERLLCWHLSQTSAVQKLNKSGQYAYLRGVSTEAALHQLVSRIEKTLNQKEEVLGLFLDVQSAFSHASFETLCNALQKMGVDPVICRWIEFMLKSRTVEATVVNCKVEKKVERGCPQVGVLSPFLWNFMIY